MSDDQVTLLKLAGGVLAAGTAVGMFISMPGHNPSMGRMIAALAWAIGTWLLGLALYDKPSRPEWLIQFFVIWGLWSVPMHLMLSALSQPFWLQVGVPAGLAVLGIGTALAVWLGDAKYKEPPPLD